MAEVLVDKQTKTYDRLSRYQTVPFYYNTVDNKYIYGITSWLKDDTAYVLHEVTRPEEDFDYLAYLYYGDPTKYWAICDYNRITNPFQKLNIGDKIKIPVISEIEFN